MSTSINVQTTTTFIVHECARCGVSFGITKRYDDERREARATFYCPNGHTLSFSGKSETEKLREQLDAEKTRAEFWRNERDRNAQRADAADRRAAAARGQVTKLKNRAAAGVCPCCNRSFVQLERHMSTKHPGFAATQVTPT